MTEWPLARACFVLWACCDSQQPTWPHSVHMRRLKVLPHSSQLCVRGSATWSDVCVHSVPVREESFMINAFLRCCQYAEYPSAESVIRVTVRLHRHDDADLHKGSDLEKSRPLLAEQGSAQAHRRCRESRVYRHGRDSSHPFAARTV